MFTDSRVSRHGFHIFISFLRRVNWEIKQISLNATSELNYSPNDAESMQFAVTAEKIDIDRNKYIYIYSGLIIIVLYLVFQRAVALYLFCLKASRRIHEQLLHGVLNAKMYFFNTNASGRIVNRFSKDLYDVDYYLALVLYDLTLVSKEKSDQIINSFK